MNNDIHSFLVDAFRELRKAWFNANLRQDSPEREWETEEDEIAREAINQKLKTKFDEQTEAIIAGHNLPICPTRPVDMG